MPGAPGVPGRSGARAARGARGAVGRVLRRSRRGRVRRSERGRGARPLTAVQEEDVRLSDTGRVEAFSDAVLAIVITLLVLDLKPPPHRPGRLPYALGQLWPSYLAFLVSFCYVGVIWLNHHALFRRVRRMAIGLKWINLGILFGAVIVPFPTEILATAFAGGSRHDERVAVVVYAAAAAVMGGPWWGAFTYLRSRPHLLEPGVTASYLRIQRVRPLTGVVLYVVCGIGGWFIAPWVGLVCVIVVILYHALTSEGLYEGPLGRLVRSVRR
ncbi:TMEM175 family protein [Streptomyces odontomachi]|uniref:TMEM175 family protein n=1 Tax=Streptomyces odontomachi TaxID=2944940 RepID=UPI0027E29741|nr:TMEM175 family protein [Streptomyces sp. ODS25]